jgi:hypothetical protein
MSVQMSIPVFGQGGELLNGYEKAPEKLLAVGF